MSRNVLSSTRGELPATGPKLDLLPFEIANSDRNVGSYATKSMLLKGILWLSIHSKSIIVKGSDAKKYIITQQ